MDLIGTILWPLKWVVSAILVGFHWVFESLGMDPGAGITWVLSIIFLTFVVRALPAAAQAGWPTLLEDVSRSCARGVEKAA